MKSTSSVKVTNEKRRKTVSYQEQWLCYILFKYNNIYAGIAIAKNFLPRKPIRIQGSMGKGTATDKYFIHMNMFCAMLCCAVLCRLAHNDEEKESSVKTKCRYSVIKILAQRKWHQSNRHKRPILRRIQIMRIYFNNRAYMYMRRIKNRKRIRRKSKIVENVSMDSI